jgi:hypothetical protein
MPHPAPRLDRSPSLASFAALLSFAVVASCGDEAASSQTKGELAVEPLARPTQARSRLPRFASGPATAPVLSWVEELESDGAPRVAELWSASWDGTSWTASTRVASGANWFVNWADFPALSKLDERNSLAHFLERSAEGRYDYAVQIVQSSDGGRSWGAPQRLHSHDGPGEHGFVSLVPLAGSGWSAVWLDGRHMAELEHGDPAGAMALYTRTVRSDGTLGPESLLDARVCDCCPTAALRGADGALWIAYRDRADDEVRDIELLRVAPDAASESAPERRWSSGDGWKIAGCPVNGPALAGSDRGLAIAWFSMGRASTAGVFCALSDDAGATFSKPLPLAAGDAMGRVDAVFDSKGALVVSWLEGSGDSAEWRVARIALDARSTPEAHIDGPHRIAAAPDGRNSGIGRLLSSGERVLFAFTESDNDQPRVAVRALTWR